MQSDFACGLTASAGYRGIAVPATTRMRLKAAHSIAQPEGLGNSPSSGRARLNGPQLNLPHKVAKSLSTTTPAVQEVPETPQIDDCGNPHEVFCRKTRGFSAAGGSACKFSAGFCGAFRGAKKLVRTNLKNITPNH
jgi:hypothetical protein